MSAERRTVWKRYPAWLPLPPVVVGSYRACLHVFLAIVAAITPAMAGRRRGERFSACLCIRHRKTTLMLPFLRRSHVKTIKPFGRDIASGILRLTLCDTSPAVADAWIDTFRDLETVEIVHGDLLEVRCDALVSPANSFGDMSGGVDKRIDDYHRGEAQRAAMEAIRAGFLGELPVGVALVLELPRPRSPLLIVAPTMRIPGNVASTLNAYLSMRATLVAVTRHNEHNEKKIARLAVPGLCTGVGGMRPGLSAVQMRAAYDTIIGGAWQEIVHPAMAPFALGSASGKRWTLE